LQLPEKIGASLDQSFDAIKTAIYPFVFLSRADGLFFAALLITKPFHTFLEVL